MVDADVVILGGGCAGLSLAARLAGSRRRAVVVEPRTHYLDDRTWSFWRTASDPFDDCVRARWTRWAVSLGGRKVVRCSSHLSYQSINSLAFYAKARTICESSPNLQLQLGVTVHADPRPAANGDGLVVETTAGRLRARIVVDTRPNTMTPGFGQYFIGREVQVDAAVFDAGEVEMMNFLTPQRDRVDFVYILPFAPDRALIEATCFAHAPPGETVLRAILCEAVATHCGNRRVEVVREERGFIPMQCVDPRRAAATAHPGWIRAGLSGGAARPSTGYAFQRIQVAALQQAMAIEEGRLPSATVHDAAVTRWMDGLFVRVLRRWPERAPDLFMRLFEHTPRDRLERFMTGSTAAQDRMAVIGSLPPALFLRELLTV
jgi:lycopene beta-cyclase